ncbi:MAG: hypothetical protein CBE26_03370 [Kiritimatiellaceae bacterium TMED266]|nr:MAG: hypothetical protein CBE26_03370 [Kiritimatiellaceae bacterium TMED266]
MRCSRWLFAYAVIGLQLFEVVAVEVSVDPSCIHEVGGVRAFDPSYRVIAEKMKKKLVNIVLGDNRLEVNWGDGMRGATGIEVFRSNFAVGADDKKLTL